MNELNALLVYSRSGYKRPFYVQYINQFIDKGNLQNSSSFLINNSILNPYNKMGYVNDWKDAFLRNRRLKTTFFDLHSGSDFKKLSPKDLT